MVAEARPLPAETGDATAPDDLAAASVLVVDDEPGMRNFLGKTLRAACGHVDVTADTDQASDMLDQQRYDVILLDNVMPRKSGVDWLAEQRRIGLYSDAILMTAYADLETAIAAIRAGASDFILKPFRSNQILNAISQSLLRARLRRQNAVLRRELEAGADVLRQRSALLGSSPEIGAVRAALTRAAATTAHVVIRGEVGSGKQVAARMLHAQSPRAEMPFLWLQCHGLSEAQFRSRLFGALPSEDEESADQNGLLLDASGGTLFLDDVERLPMVCQNLLFELLSTGRFQPLGAARSLDLDVRIICSSTRALSQAVADKSFRADLYYLLNVVEIVLPPLRERAQDVLDLLDFFVEHLCAQMVITPPDLSPALRRRILAYDWPGNVMELRNYVERALIHQDFETGPAASGSPFASAEQTETLATVEQRHILQVLEACDGNRAEAARRLGLARKTIDRKCQAWGV